jgi:hypothetical protein
LVNAGNKSIVGTVDGQREQLPFPKFYSQGAKDVDIALPYQNKLKMKL